MKTAGCTIIYYADMLDQKRITEIKSQGQNHTLEDKSVLLVKLLFEYKG